MSKKKPPYLLVKNRSALSRIATELKKETSIGVDLEADSLFHYQEKVCLIQISTPSKNFLVDPLSLDDLSPLSPVFSDPNIQKVLHGADYDIRSLYRDFGIEVNALFDTQIAAKFLGIMETGLARLLKDRLGVVVDKKYQKRDWSQRPLPDAMLTYAVTDTLHLLPLSRILEDELRQRGRLFCVEEECKLLSRVRPLPPDNNPLFLKFNGAKRLDPRGLGVLESILQLRNDTARRRDRPPFKVLVNEAILEIAERCPVTEKDLEPIKGLNVRQIKTLGRSILKKTAEALQMPQSDLPVFPKNNGRRITGKVSKRAKLLKEWRAQRAKQIGLDPSLVLTNAQIMDLALSHPKARKDLKEIDTIRAWQRKLFGSEICSLLKGIA